MEAATSLDREIQTAPIENLRQPFAFEEAGSRAGEVVTKNTAELDTFNSELTYSDLVPNATWGRLTNRIEEKENLNHDQAERIMNESLGFLKACAENPGIPLAPSEKVDIGWHTFILCTQDYAEFCENTAGRFIHHEPDDAESTEEMSLGMTAEDSFAFLASNGYKVDSELWLEGTVSDASVTHASCSVPPTGPPRPTPPPAPGCHTNCSVR